MPFSFLLLQSDDVLLTDVIAIIGRLTDDVHSVANWKNLPSAKLEYAISPILWLPRATFKQNIRKAKFRGWPKDPKTGKPVGGEALRDAEKARISKSNAIIPDAVLDTVFDSWDWGASISTPDKVDGQLKSWRRDRDSFDLNNFVWTGDNWFCCIKFYFPSDLSLRNFICPTAFE